ncbi:hypothetical protein YC2023_124501 [Brassica napus]
MTQDVSNGGASEQTHSHVDLGWCSCRISRKFSIKVSTFKATHGRCYRYDESDRKARPMDHRFSLEDSKASSEELRNQVRNGLVDSSSGEETTPLIFSLYSNTNLLLSDDLFERLRGSWTHDTPTCEMLLSWMRRFKLCGKWWSWTKKVVREREQTKLQMIDLQWILIIEERTRRKKD